MISICRRVVVPCGEPMGARVLQAAREHRVGIDVRQDGEALLHKNLGGLERLDGVGQQVARIRVDFELHPVWHSGGDGQAGQAHGLLSGEGAAGIWQQKDVVRDVIEDVGEGVAFA